MVVGGNDLQGRILALGCSHFRCVLHRKAGQHTCLLLMAAACKGRIQAVLQILRPAEAEGIEINQPAEEHHQAQQYHTDGMQRIAPAFCGGIVIRQRLIGLFALAFQPLQALLPAGKYLMLQQEIPAERLLEQHDRAQDPQGDGEQLHRRQSCDAQQAAPVVAPEKFQHEPQKGIGKAEDPKALVGGLFGEHDAQHQGKDRLQLRGGKADAITQRFAVAAAVQGAAQAGNEQRQQHRRGHIVQAQPDLHPAQAQQKR